MENLKVLKINNEEIPVQMNISVLANLEEALKVTSISDLFRILMNPSANQILTLLRVLLKSASREDLIENIESLDVPLGQFLRLLSTLCRDVMHGSSSQSAADEVMTRSELEQMIADTGERG